jgi:hypothetical protein
LAGGATLLLTFLPVISWASAAAIGQGNITASAVMGKNAHDGAQCQVPEGAYGLGAGQHTVQDISCEST